MKPTQLYNDIVNAKSVNRKLLAILLDPDKIPWENIEHLTAKISESPATHIFVGGSAVSSNRIDELITILKSHCNLPILLFPGNPSQISDKADGILFLSLISGRNPDYLIEHHVRAAPILKKSALEIIPTGYILINGGNQSAVQTVTKTTPIDPTDANLIVSTSLAGEMLGKKLIYLEAGSGAKLPVPTKIITEVSQNINVPLIVGGGITSNSEIQKAYDSGADLIVIGTAFENDHNFFSNQK